MVVVAAPPGHEVEVERIVGELAGVPGEPGRFIRSSSPAASRAPQSVGHALAEVPARPSSSPSTTPRGRWSTAELIDALVARLADDPTPPG